MTTKNPLEHIAFEDINEEYCYGNYGDFKVIMMKENGYINATKMCQYISEQTGSKKTMMHWNENKLAGELNEAVSSYIGLSIDELTIQITGGQLTIIRGTYVHPYLIHHIASWASPKFAVKVSCIITKYFNKKELKEKKKLIRKQEKLIEKKNCIIEEKTDKIDELMELTKQQTEETKQQSAKIDRLLHKNKKMSHKLNDIKEINEDISEQNTELLQKVDTITEDRVVKAQPKHNPVFVIMKTPSKNINRYYAIRTQKMSVKRAIKNYIEKHNGAVELLRIEYNPNSINLWDRVKNGLYKKIRTSGCSFTLRTNYTEKKLIKDIKKVNEEKYDV